jgi:hypothetical protein
MVRIFEHSWLQEVLAQMAKRGDNKNKKDL